MYWVAKFLVCLVTVLGGVGMRVRCRRGERLEDLWANLAPHLQGRVALTSQARRTAKKYSGSIGTKVEGALRAMANLLWGMYFDPVQRSGNIESEFYCRSGYKVALRECRQTNRTSHMRRKRKVKFGGETLDAVSHVKFREKGKHFRIYYAVDHVRSLLVVGCLGPHLETAGTRFCR